MKSFKYDIILSSGSPRRKELLEAIGIPFKVDVKSIDEKIKRGTPTEKVAIMLAIQKGEVWVDEIQPNQLIITADTVVVHENKVLGKPKDWRQAMNMLKKLSESTHEVYTGVAFTTLEKKTAFTSKSLVTFEKINNRDIEAYIETGSPMDKAGAYGIQDPFGLRFVSKIEGSYSNIIGLPTSLVWKTLMHF